MILTKRAVEFRAVTHVTQFIASSSAAAIQYPLSLSFSWVRSLNQNLIPIVYSPIQITISDDHFSFVPFRYFSFLISFEK